MDLSERLKLIRKKNKMTQQEFADALNLKQNTIATYEIGRTVPSDRTLKDICEKFNIQEAWIKTGEGDMEYPPEDEAAAYVSELLGPEENPLFDLIKAIMKTYSESGPQERQIIESFAKELRNNMKKDRG